MAIVFSAPATPSFTSSFPSQSKQSRLVGSSSSLHLQAQKAIRFLSPAINSSASPLNKNLIRSVSTTCKRSGGLQVVTEATWEECVMNSSVPVLVEFWAAWCGPCTMVHREIEEIAKEYVGRINCYKLKVDDDLDVAEKYGIKGVPVVMFFKNGAKQDSIIGTMPNHIYVAAIEKLLTS